MIGYDGICRRWNKAAVTLVILIGFLASFTLNTLAYQEREEGQAVPEVYLDYLSIGTVNGKIGPDSRPLNYLNNDLFYLEYPGSWTLGTNDYCPFLLYNNSDYEYERTDFRDFQDIQLRGEMADIKNYIEAGAIKTYLVQVLGRDLAPDEKLVLEEESDPILYYTLKKNKTSIASVIVWCNIGQVSIRSEIREVTMNPVTNQGKIMLIPEWDTTDFSSTESIRTFVDGGGMKPYLDYLIGTPTWNMSEYSTAYHQYLYCEGETATEKIAVFIPVTAKGNKNWVLCFQTYRASQAGINAFNMREEIVKTFQILK